MSRHAYWMQNSVHPNLLKATAEHIASQILKDFEAGVPMDAIAVTGMSGTIIGGLVSVLTGLPLVIVRKTEGQGHSSNLVEYLRPFNDYIILDDLVATGTTITRIQSAVSRYEPGASLSKIYMYHQERRYDIYALPLGVDYYAVCLKWGSNGVQLTYPRD